MPRALEDLGRDLNESFRLWIGWKWLIGEHAEGIIELFPPIPVGGTGVLGDLKLADGHELTIDVHHLEPVAMPIHTRVGKVEEAEWTRTSSRLR